MPYLIIECDEHYEHCVIGFPSREYCWIMNRSPIMADATYQKLTKQLEEKHQYNLEGLRKVPQVWTKAERDKRGLTKEIPDALLTEK
jgi:apolipoprotein D and lipocalin family protein